MSSIYLFDIISVVVPEHSIFLCIPAPAADAVAVNPNKIKMLSANGWTTSFIKGNSVFGNGSTVLPRNPPDCIILDNCVFDSLLAVDDLLTKALLRFATCALLNNNLCEKLVSSLKLQFHFLLLILIY